MSHPDLIDTLIDLHGKPHPDADWQDVVREAAIYHYRQDGVLCGHTLSLAARMVTRELACEVIRASQEYGTIIPPGPYDPADLDPEAGYPRGDAGYSEVRNENGSHK